MLVSGLVMVIVAYLIGSVPVGLLLGRVCGIDIREHGSGNLGATNIYRSLGLAAGVAVFVLDAAKGALPVLAALMLFGGPSEVARSTVLVLTGLAAIAGHNWSIYLGFQGGKGVSTGAGVLLVLFPAVTGVLFVVWVVVLLLSRYVSLASIVISLVFPVLVVLLNGSNGVYVAFSLVAAAVVIFKHRSNVGRILGGTEPKVWSTSSKDMLE